MADEQSKWLKLFSIEILGSIMVTIFLVGGSWASLNARVSAGDARDIEQQAKVESVSLAVHEIQVDVAVVKEQTRTTKKALEDQAHLLEKQGEKLDEILTSILRQGR